MLKELTEEKVKASVKNLSGNNRTDTVDEDVKLNKILQRIEREVKKTTDKDSSKFSYEVMLNYMKAYMLNSDMTVEALREYCVQQSKLDELDVVPYSTLCSWRKKVDKFKKDVL